MMFYLWNIHDMSTMSLYNISGSWWSRRVDNISTPFPKQEAKCNNAQVRQYQRSSIMNYFWYKSTGSVQEVHQKI